MTARKTKKRVKKRAKKRVIKKRRVVKKRVAKKGKAVVKKPREKVIGIVTHYFPQVKAAAIKLKAPLNLWDNVKIKGHTTDFTQTASSLQVDCQPITKGKKGQEIGLLVNSRVRRKDLVYKA